MYVLKCNVHKTDTYIELYLQVFLLFLTEHGGGGQAREWSLFIIFLGNGQKSVINRFNPTTQSPSELITNIKSPLEQGSSHIGSRSDIGLGNFWGILTFF